MSMLWAKRGWASPGSQFLRAVEQLGATDAWDFVDGVYVRSGRAMPDPGLTVTRASSGYAETSDGRLVSFASGVARRTDKGLLIEGARTNLLLRSQEFDDAAWFQASATPTENAALAPDGTLTANSIVKSNNFGNVRQQVAITANATFTFSVYVKAGTATNGSIGVFENSLGTLLSRASVNLSTGAVANDVGTTNAQSVGNGWWRVSTTVTTTTASNVAAALYPSVASDNNAGTTLFWGAQLEAGNFASSYIKTEGSTGTRAADLIVVNQTGPTYPITLYAEINGATPNGEPLPRFLQWEAGTGARIELVNADPTLTTDRTYAYVGLGGEIDAAVVSGLSGRKKVAAKIESGALRLSGNGGAVASGTATGTAPTGDLYFGNRTDGARSVFDYLRRVAIFPSAFTDAQLQAITS